jgi:hypothetical protein
MFLTPEYVSDYAELFRCELQCQYLVAISHLPNFHFLATPGTVSEHTAAARIYTAVARDEQNIHVVKTVVSKVADEQGLILKRQLELIATYIRVGNRESAILVYVIL